MFHLQTTRGTPLPCAPLVCRRNRPYRGRSPTLPIELLDSTARRLQRRRRTSRSAVVEEIITERLCIPEHRSGAAGSGRRKGYEIWIPREAQEDQRRCAGYRHVYRAELILPRRIDGA